MLRLGWAGWSVVAVTFIGWRLNPGVAGVLVAGHRDATRVTDKLLWGLFDYSSFSRVVCISDHFDRTHCPNGSSSRYYDQDDQKGCTRNCVVDDGKVR